MVELASADQAASAGRLKATALFGGGAIGLWSLAPSLLSWADSVPPLQLLATALSFATLFTAMLIVGRGGNPVVATIRHPIALARGLVGNFVYNSVYVAAFKFAPPVQANLLNYLWPVLSVLAAVALARERIAWYHLAGLALGFIGGVVLLTDGNPAAGVPDDLTIGHLFGLLAALSFAAYSVWGRTIRDAPLEALPGWLFVSALCAALCHLGIEATVWPDPDEWLAMAAVGTGCGGAAVFLWELALKRGDFRILNALAYSSPLLSTVWLIALGLDRNHWSVWVSCILIVGGAVLASQQVFRRGAV